MSEESAADRPEFDGESVPEAARKPFRWRTSISWKTVDRIVCRGYDINELAANVSFAEMVFLLFQSRLPTPAQSAMLDYFMVVFVEHALSPSTAAARLTAAGRPPLNAAIAAGILTFGDAHGPGLAYGRMMRKTLAAAKAAGESFAAAADRLVERRAAEGRRIPGLNQPQHVRGDPRAPGVSAKARELGVAGEYVALQEAINTAAARRHGPALKPNLLGAAGPVLLDLGFSPEASFAIGVLCRGFSCAAHAIEEAAEESPWRASRRGDETDILDLSLQGPDRYAGPADRVVPPRAERGAAPRDGDSPRRDRG